jgi:hypothetical protein
MKITRRPKQPTPVLPLATALFADLLREGATKHDDRERPA